MKVNREEEEDGQIDKDKERVKRDVRNMAIDKYRETESKYC